MRDRRPYVASTPLIECLNPQDASDAATDPGCPDGSGISQAEGQGRPLDAAPIRCQSRLRLLSHRDAPSRSLVRPRPSSCGWRICGGVFTIHATKKLRDRVKAPIGDPVEEPSTALGNWYATALFWKPQVALFVNEGTLVPVLLPLAPAKTVAERFPAHLEAVLNALGIDPRFVAAEVAACAEVRWAKTASRSVVGIMNEFSFLADVDRAHERSDDLVAMATRLAGTPCSPLYKRHGSPDRELRALVAAHLGE